jgi:hypothetical protein
VSKRFWNSGTAIFCTDELLTPEGLFRQEKKETINKNKQQFFML